MKAKLAYWITGDKIEDVEIHPSFSRKKIKMFAALIFLPTTLWAFMGFFVARSLLGDSVICSIATGVVCSIIVFILDRSIILSEGKGIIAWFRVLLGLAVAIIGAVLIDSIIFKSDVDRYMNEKYQNIADNKSTQKAAEFDQKIDKQKGLVNSSSIYWKKRTEEYKAEIEGSAGTGLFGVGNVARAKEQLMNKAEKEYNNQLLILKNIKNKKTQAMKETSDITLASMGLESVLHRIQNLHEMVFSNWLTAMFYFVFFFIALSIELLVVLLKVFSKKSTYEKEQELKEIILDNRYKMCLEKMEYYRELGVKRLEINETLNKSSHKHPLLISN